MSAAHFRAANLCAIVDANRLQIDGRVAEIMNVEPIAAKFVAFGWNALEIDGHDMAQILGALDQARAVTDRPTVIVARTVVMSAALLALGSWGCSQKETAPSVAAAPAGPPPTPTIEQIRAATVSGIFEQAVTLVDGVYHGAPAAPGACLASDAGSLGACDRLRRRRRCRGQ